MSFSKFDSKRGSAPRDWRALPNSALHLSRMRRKSGKNAQVLGKRPEYLQVLGAEGESEWLIRNFGRGILVSGKGQENRQAEDDVGQLSLPLGVRLVETLRKVPIATVRETMEGPEVDAALAVIEEALSGSFRPGFMHSALCAMSLPTRRPKDETAPIVRRDGDYSLVITPRKRFEPGPDGEMVEVCRGVPFGALARVVLFYIMTEAVRNRSPNVFLGSNFSEWLRRMGIKATRSGGERSSRALVQEQIERLMNCEWSVRYDGPPSRRKGAKAGEGVSAFFVSDLRLTRSYAGLKGAEGSFVGCFVLSHEFYQSLIEHSVPLAENAVRALKSSALSLDLYAWLAYRLPRIAENEEVMLSWTDLSKHFGSGAGTMGKFRQLVREAWNDVACAYPQARHSADFSGLTIRLRYADAPTRGQLVLFDSGLIGEAGAAQKKVSQQAALSRVPRLAQRDDTPLLDFPEGSLRFGERELRFREVALELGGGWDVDQMAEAFRRGFRDLGRKRTDADWMKVWSDFCRGYFAKRGRP